jgi:hypothetical protein
MRGLNGCLINERINNYRLHRNVVNLPEQTSETFTFLKTKGILKCDDTIQNMAMKSKCAERNLWSPE